jgi:hypothetical protein
MIPAAFSWRISLGETLPHFRNTHLVVKSFPEALTVENATPITPGVTPDPQE